MVYPAGKLQWHFNTLLVASILDMIVDMIPILDMIAICSRFCSPEGVNRIFFLGSVNTAILKLILKSDKVKYL